MARHIKSTLDPALEATLPFGLERLGQEALVVQVAQSRLLTDRVELGIQMLELELLEQGG